MEASALTSWKKSLQFVGGRWKNRSFECYPPFSIKMETDLSRGMCVVLFSPFFFFPLSIYMYAVFQENFLFSPCTNAYSIVSCEHTKKVLFMVIWLASFFLGNYNFHCDCYCIDGMGTVIYHMDFWAGVYRVKWIPFLLIVRLGLYSSFQFPCSIVAYIPFHD